MLSCLEAGFFEAALRAYEQGNVDEAKRLIEANPSRFSQDKMRRALGLSAQ